MLIVSDDFNKAGATLTGLNAPRSAVGVAVKSSSGRLKSTLSCQLQLRPLKMTTR